MIKVTKYQMAEPTKRSESTIGHYKEKTKVDGIEANDDVTYQVEIHEESKT